MVWKNISHGGAEAQSWGEIGGCPGWRYGQAPARLSRGVPSGRWPRTSWRQRRLSSPKHLALPRLPTQDLRHTGRQGMMLRRMCRGARACPLGVAAPPLATPESSASVGETVERKFRGLSPIATVWKNVSHGGAEAQSWRNLGSQPRTLPPEPSGRGNKVGAHSILPVHSLGSVRFGLAFIVLEKPPRLRV